MFVFWKTKTQNSQLTLIFHIPQSAKNVCFDLVGNVFFARLSFLRPDLSFVSSFSIFVLFIIHGLRA